MGADSSLDEAPGNILNKALEMDTEFEELETPTGMMLLPVPLSMTFLCQYQSLVEH